MRNSSVFSNGAVEVDSNEDPVIPEKGYICSLASMRVVPHGKNRTYRDVLSPYPAIVVHHQTKQRSCASKVARWSAN